MSTALTILLKIFASLVTEKLFKEVMANGLEIVIKMTSTDIDNKLLQPVIDALRGK